MEKITRVALYIRVSHDEQVREGLSLDTQKAHLIEYAKKHNYKVVDIYADEGVSARKSYKHRKEFCRLIDDVECEKIDLILFIKLDRWFRSVADYHKIQEVLEKHKVAWKATTENYDTTTANGRLYVNIRLAVAQDEADRTSERIKFINEKKIQDGEVISGSVPYGYKIKNKKLVIDIDKVEIVKYIYNKYIELKSKRATIQALKKDYNIVLEYKRIDRILGNSLYIGKHRNNTNFCEPMVSEELYNKAQELRQETARRFARVDGRFQEYCYIFSGLVKCPLCGGAMSGVKTLGYTKKDGEKVYYYYYRCTRMLVQKGCTNRSYLNELVIEKYLLENISPIISRYKINYNTRLKQKKKQSLNQENKKSIETKIKRLQNLYINELIEIEEYKLQYKKLQEELEMYKEKPIQEKDLSKLDNFLNDDFLQIYEKLNNENKRLLWHSIIDRIIPVLEDNKAIKYKVYLK